MRPIGFSTGALAKSDFRAGVAQQRAFAEVRAIELSALRDHELAHLRDGLGSLDLSGFEYVSVHAPSKLRTLSEHDAFEALASLPPEWPIVAHPELLTTPSLWRALGARLVIENMDSRKAFGRTASELRSLFETFPDAGFCLDVGHARQIDPTMAGALLMLFEFGSRLRQVHVSDVSPTGAHQPVRAMAHRAFQRVAHKVPVTVPLIIESVIPAAAMNAELANVLAAFDVPRQQAATPAHA